MRPSFAEVDLAAVAANVAAIAEEVAPASLCAVVKADGYGHGDVAVAQAAREAGAGRLAVALVEEGIRLRRAGLEGPVLVLSEPPLSAGREVLRWRLTPTVYRSEFVEALEREADGRQAVHLKVDTGMHRVGADAEQALEVARLVSDSERLELEGVWTHLAVAESDPRFTRHQLAAFHGFLRDLTDKGIEPRLAHAANTAAALLYPEARLDMVRVGLGLYGLRPAPHVAPALPLRPAMRVVSHVSLVRRLPPGARPSYGRRRSLPSAATVATVPVGYADGVPRALAERGGEVLWGGRRLPFAGTITMDHVMVDAGDLPVAVGDEVVLIGRQGDEEVTADEWAERLGTINYEVVSRIGPRLERRYHR